MILSSRILPPILLNPCKKQHEYRRWEKICCDLCLEVIPMSTRIDACEDCDNPKYKSFDATLLSVHSPK